MRATRLGLVLLCLLYLGGCGYRPLYGTANESSGVVQALASISIAEADTRLGQIIRNDLLSGMRPAGTAGEDKYRLVITPQSKNSDIIDTKQPNSSRESVNITVAFELQENGKVIYSGKSFSQVSYDRVSAADTTGHLMVRGPLANYQAQLSATERAAHELSVDIRTRLAAYFASH
ncbi:MAG: hypothetical protein HYX36_07440 [Rhizobiales bacterium]|nr:hypothetical protein [Hyphomicrobiales bacterium]